MTGLDELIRETLIADAETHHPDAGLVSGAVTSGRRIRRRRQAGGVAALAVAAAVVVGGSLALADSTGGSAAPTQPGAGSPSPQMTVTTTHRVGEWRKWPADRRYGAKPGAAFFNEGAPGPVYASGTLPDGTEFALYGTGHRADPIDWHQGWNDSPDFGDSPGSGSPLFRPDVTYFGMESPTLAAHAGTGGASQWLIVVGQPDTTSASYSTDGTTWQQMSLHDGIAVIKLAKPFSPGAELRLTNSTGLYFGGRLQTL